MTKQILLYIKFGTFSGFYL